MKCFFARTRLGSIAAISLAIIGATVAPNVSAQDARTETLERSLQQLESSMQAIRNELNQLKSESGREAQKLMKIEERSASIEKQQAVEAQKVTKIEETAASVEKHTDSKSHVLFFHGGYARTNDLRDGVSIQSGGIGGPGGRQTEMHGISARVLTST